MSEAINPPVIRLAYGKHGLQIKTGEKWNVTLIEPVHIRGLNDPVETIRSSLRNPVASRPLKQLVKDDDKVAIIFNDITRPTPNKIIIETILEEIKHVPASSVMLFNAVGTHREDTREELELILGGYLSDNYRIIQNNAFDKGKLVHAGTTSKGNEIMINRELMSCNVKILTGFIEPHFFAGFSGGGKAVMPGMAGIDTILRNHSALNISNKYASWGITIKNPVWEEVREVATMANASFLVNVTLNRDKEITGVFSGDIRKAHLEGIESVRKSCMRPVSTPFDIVVTTNSGYPLDINLYQTVKGMSAAARIVKQGGMIIVAAECRDGLPGHGLFGKLLRESENPEDLLEKISSPGFSKQDQWQAQILAQIQLKADIYLYSEYLSEEQLKAARIKRCNDIYNLIESAYQKKGPDISVCILPEGPQTIPYLTGD